MDNLSDEQIKNIRERTELNSNNQVDLIKFARNIELAIFLKLTEATTNESLVAAQDAQPIKPGSRLWLQSIDETGRTWNHHGTWNGKTLIINSSNDVTATNPNVKNPPHKIKPLSDTFGVSRRDIENWNNCKHTIDIDGQNEFQNATNETRRLNKLGLPTDFEHVDVIRTSKGYVETTITSYSDPGPNNTNVCVLPSINEAGSNLFTLGPRSEREDFQSGLDAVWLTVAKPKEGDV
jgi:hypothetical protein